PPLPVALATLASGVFACAAPFAAVAAYAALVLPRRDGLAAVLLAWLANQAVGFGLLGYPHDPSTLAWGLALAAAALLAWGAAGAVARAARGRTVAVAVAALAAGFAAYEAALLAAGLVLPGGGLAAFTPAVVARLFLIDLAALAAMALLRIAAGAGARAITRKAPAA
ncbi:hypothetical protein, partial [Methylobacterium oryzisoli]|uniref:hypothetical protein n=1 Tax=Methylobacterium oryzisoli TaxID=3385502 RepID=UPI003891B0B4